MPLCLLPLCLFLAFINRWLDIVKEVLVVEETFGMTDKEVAALLEVAVEAFNKCRLGGFIEVNHAVSAENNIKLIAYRPLCIHEVHSLEGYRISQLGLYPYLALIFVLPLLEIFPKHLRLQSLGIFINALLCEMQNLRGDITGGNFEINLWIIFEEFGENNTKGIRFFSGGTGCRPNINGATLFLRDNLRQCSLCKEMKMTDFSKEVGFIGGNGIEEQYHLLALKSFPLK